MIRILVFILVLVNCGFENLSQAIGNGIITTSFTPVISLRIKFNNGVENLCTGTFVSSEHQRILTAAHCMEAKSFSSSKKVSIRKPIRVWINQVLVNSFRYWLPKELSIKNQEHLLSSYAKEDDIKNDYSMITISVQDAKLYKNLGYYPITNERFHEGTPVTLVGYGRSRPLTGVQVLQSISRNFFGFAQLPIKRFGENKITAVHADAYLLQGVSLSRDKPKGIEVGVLEGDSGSPLLVRRNVDSSSTQSEFEIIGIASFYRNAISLDSNNIMQFAYFGYGFTFN